MRRAQMATYPAPIAGWIRNATYINPPPNSAEVLDNWFPTAQGCKMRSGKSKHATVTGTVKQLFNYRSGSQSEMFAATETAIYDVTTPADETVSPTAAVSGLAGGNWSSVQFANNSGEYVVIANGSDDVRHYNGTTWATPSISGATSSTLSQVWTFKERLFFVEENTLSFWYLGVNAIAGAATEYQCHGIFHLGGALLFGATWSVDSGSGMNDVCVLVTTEGEVAIFNGSDPSSAASWALEGVYRIGRPLDKNGWFKSGSDLMVLTEDGIVSVLDALNKTSSQLQLGALSYPIEDAWREAISNRSSAYQFAVALWPTKTMLIVGTPSVDGNLDVAFVANARTGAWCRYTGWDVRCVTIYDDWLYFGEPGVSESVIYKAESGGSDDSIAFDGHWVPKFLDGAGEFKAAIHARFRGRAAESYNVGVTAFADYVEGNYPTVSPTPDENSNVWGTGLWDTMVWGGLEDRNVVTKWQAARAAGTALAPAVTVPSNRVTANTLEAIALDLLYERGSVL